MTVTHGSQWLVGVGEGDIHQMAYKTFIIALDPLVYFIKCEEHLLLSRPGIYGIAFLHISLHKLVAPPGEPHVLGRQVVSVLTTVVQVFQRKQLLGVQ